MPTYDWVCPYCGAVEEACVKASERDEPRLCSICETVMRRRIGAPLVPWFDGTTRSFYKERRRVPDELQ